jgi:pyruvate dehydrogenase E2 component (dihydrolipoamide acetyltransferase)
VLTAAEGGTSGKDADAEKRTGEPSSLETTEEGKIERVEMSGIRKTIASKMEESRFTAPHVTHVEKADVTELVELRNQKKEEVDVHLTYLPFIMKAVVLGLKEFPNLNAELDEENSEIVRKLYYNFNMAVDTENGLMVPVIKDVDDRNILELAEQIVEKAEHAKDGGLEPDEMKGGTFSITNLGVIGGEEFTPIINYPQTAILGIGKIQETAEVVDGMVQPRNTVKLSLSYDHRVVDGAEAARFMNAVVENLENPEKMLLKI